MANGSQPWMWMARVVLTGLAIAGMLASAKRRPTKKARGQWIAEARAWADDALKSIGEPQ